MKNNSVNQFRIWASGSDVVSNISYLETVFSGVEPFYAILKEGIIGDIHVKLYEIWTSGS